MLKMVDLIARREGFGDLLAEGSRRAAQVIGGEALLLANEVKGQELPFHDPRGKVAVGLGYAISETGADHLVSYHDTMFANSGSLAFQSAQPLGITQALPARELSEAKVAMYLAGENWSSFEKVSGFCYFGPAPRSFIPISDILDAMHAATGWELTLDDLLRIGERATVLARLFNLREGFTAADDRLPERMFTPSENGALAGVAIDREEFSHALQQLYTLKGWDPETGVPTRERLEALELVWAADLLGIQ
jgi:aldehyde:ferredoxin oxidoreductase